MGPQHTDFEKLCKYMSTYSTNPKPTLLRVSRHVVANHPKPKTMDEGEVRILIRERDIAYRSGDRAQYCMARANSKRGIKVAKK